MSQPNRKKWGLGKKLLLLAVVACVGGGVGFYFVKKKEKPIPVQTDKVVRRNLIETVEANGRVQPVVQVVIQPEVSGEIIELPVKEGQAVKKGDLLLKIKPDNYIASRNSSEASYKSSLANNNLAAANLEKARLELGRAEALHKSSLISESAFLEVKTAYDVQRATHETSTHQVAQAKAALARAEDDLSKTSIQSPIDGTVTKLRSQRGERVVGTAMMAGTEIMTIADLSLMEARVDVGEIDVVDIAIGQKAILEVDAFRDKKFHGKVTEIANAAKGAAGSAQMATSSTEATRFEIKILIEESEAFRPGMTVNARIETHYRTNVLTVPIMAVTTRAPNQPGGTNSPPSKPQPDDAGQAGVAKRSGKDSNKPVEVVFGLENGKAKLFKVKSGVRDDNHMEIEEGLVEGQEIISGNFAAVSRLLEEGKLVQVGGVDKGPPAAPAAGSR